MCSVCLDVHVYMCDDGCVCVWQWGMDGDVCACCVSRVCVAMVDGWMGGVSVWGPCVCVGCVCVCAHDLSGRVSLSVIYTNTHVRIHSLLLPCLGCFWRTKPQPVRNDARFTIP